MLKSEENLRPAIRQVMIAEHMLTQTYPLVNDEKLLLGIADKIHKSIGLSLKAVLDFEKKYKRIPAFQENFAYMFNMFKKKCQERYQVNDDLINSFESLHGIIEEHIKTPVEFARKGKFVICVDEYEMRTISPDDLKEQINYVQKFISKIKEGMDKYERFICRGTNLHSKC